MAFAMFLIKTLANPFPICYNKLCKSANRKQSELPDFKNIFWGEHAMKKTALILLVLCMITTLSSCAKQDVVSDEATTYEITTEIHSLDIRLNAADVVFKYSDNFSVESNLRYLSVSEKDGVLTIIDETTTSKIGIKNTTFENAMLTLCIPTDQVFEDVDLETGACKLTSCALSANSIKLSLGAGNVCFESLNAATRTNIQGGAGSITVQSGSLNNLSLEMGVGELDLTAALLGSSDLEFGIGEAMLTLIGSADDYQIDVNKGIGSITIDGQTVTAFGNGENRIKLNGGVGTLQVNFRES